MWHEREIKRNVHREEKLSQSLGWTLEMQHSSPNWREKKEEKKEKEKETKLCCKWEWREAQSTLTVHPILSSIRPVWIPVYIL